MSETAALTDGTANEQYLRQPGFHKKFTLPATADHGPLEVGYSDLGRQPSVQEGSAGPPPVVLFMPGMFASRYHGLLLGLVGEKLGVRILTVDRPGMGMSTDVPSAQRVPVWVELVPKLLSHLNIAHVALISHSAGTMFLLNTLYSCRDVLCPIRPYAALIGPFVDVKHSGVTILQAAQFIPSTLFGSWNKIAKSMDANIAPVIGSSLSFVGKWLPESVSSEPAQPEMSKNRRHWQRFGVSDSFLDTILTDVAAAMFKENTAGANSEAKLCLKKDGDGTWAECEDYQIFCNKLVEQERSRAETTPGGAKLRVKILFAQEDALSGKAGQKYMESCWRHESEFGDVLEYSSATVEDTNHDSLLSTAAVLEEVIGDVADIDTVESTGTS